MGLRSYPSRVVDYTGQTNWWVDPAGTFGGSDGNTGGSAASPLRTLAEWRRRACKGGVTWEPAGFGILTIMSDCAESAYFNIVGVAASRDGTIRGRDTVVATGTVTAAAQLSSAGGGTYATLTSTGTTWAPHVGRRVRIQGSGDDWLPGLYAYVRADLGSGVALVTPWTDGGGQAAAPSPGATWEVYTVPKVSGQWGITCNSADHYVAVDFDVGGDPFVSGIYVTAGYGSQVHSLQVLSDGYTFEAQAGSYVQAYGVFAAGGHIRSQSGHLVLCGGGSTGAGQRIYAIDGYVVISGAMMLENNAFLNVQGGASLLVNAEVGIRNSNTRAIAVTDGKIQLSQKVFATGSTATNGIEVEAGQTLLVAPGMLPSISTPTNFASIGGVAKSAAALVSDYVAPNGASLVYKIF